MVQVAFSIAADGAIDSVSIAKTTVRHKALERCLLTTIKRWRFPKPEGAKPRVVYPFHFKPRGS